MSQGNSETHKTKTILKVVGIKPHVIYLNELWTVFDSICQGYLFAFCVWMVAAMNRHVIYRHCAHNVLTRWVLKSRVKILVYFTLY
jgi:hypothetical protein